MKRAFCLFAKTLTAIVLLYCGAALIGSYWSRNSNWRETPNGVTIYIADNGVHTAFVVPAAAAGVDWSMTFRPTDLPSSDLAGNWMIIGWGDRDFFLGTPTWADVRPRTVISAAFGSGGSLIHVDHLTAPMPGADMRPVTISEGEYRKLSAIIDATLIRDGDGHPSAIPGYGSRDVFYPARGNYNLFHTCNSWTADTLAAVGMRAPLWTPFGGGVMHWFPLKR
jgi:uncharacterized protein (TIGR02117 family)